MISGHQLKWLSVCLLAAASVSAQQPAGLRIVVISGEDGVNIIQTKTAVQPIDGQFGSHVLKVDAGPDRNRPVR